MVTIVSWNTLESGQGGAWADGWGCPLEIQRWKEELVQWKKLQQTININNTISSDSGGSTTTTAPSTTEAEKEEEEEIKEIQRLLTNQRYTRIRNTIINEMNDHDTAIDFYLFQELTEGNTWDEHFNTNNDTNSSTDDIDNNDNDHRFGFESESESEFTQFPPSTYERVPCQEDDDNDNDSGDDGDSDKTVQRIYVRTESGWKSKRSYTLHSDVLEGGCLVEFQQPQQQHHSPLGVDHGTGNEDNEDDEVEEEEHQQQQLFLVNLHGNSKKMRDPHLRQRGIMELWKEIGSYLTTNKNKDNNTNEHENKNKSWWWWMEKIIVCGDFNTHLSDLITPTIHYLTTADSSDTNTTTTSSNTNNNNILSGLSSLPVLLEPVVGLLRNSTATSTSTGPIPVFSTNHEDGFLAQYDGCLFFRHNPNPNSDVTAATTTPTNTPISSSEPVSLSSEGLSSEASSAIVSSSSSISSSYLELENVSWNLTGFMPKGRDGKLPGSSSSSEHPYYNNFTYHSSYRDGDDDGDGDGEHGDDDGIYLNGIFLGSGTVPSLGMSDHLRIYTTIRIHNHHHNHNHNNDHPIKDHNYEYEYEHQRRPPQHHSDTYN